MPVRRADATWEGGFPRGEGRMKLGSGAFDGRFSFATRMQDEPGANPEELLGAAHAGCFSMALAAALTRAGHEPRRIQTRADVHLDKVGEGFKITRIRLDTQGDVPGIDEATFRKFADDAKTNCIISQALRGTPVELNAQMASTGEGIGTRS